MARTAEVMSARLEGRTWLRLLARTGLAARGVVYLVLALFAADIALHGNSPAPVSGNGAVEEVARQPAGPLLLAVLAAGFAAYSAWRLVEAASGREKPGKTRNIWVRIGWLAIAVLYAYLGVQAITLLIQAGSATGGGGAGKSRAVASSVMGWPAGQELLGAAGAAVIAGGVALAAWGVLRKYEKSLCLDGRTPLVRTAPKVLGAAGDIARGGIAVLVGVYLLRAAADRSPSSVKTVDQALLAFAHNSYGVALIALIAVGEISFCAFSFFEAWLRDL